MKETRIASMSLKLESFLCVLLSILIYNIFRKPTQCMAIVNLLMVLTTVYALNQYDDTLFRKEFLAFLPDIGGVLKGTVLEDSMTRWVATKITTTALITAIKTYLDTTTECKAASRTAASRNAASRTKSRSPKKI